MPKKGRKPALQPETHAEIAKKYARGLGLREIAAEYAVSKNTIARIVKKEGVTPLKAHIDVVQPAVDANIVAGLGKAATRIGELELAKGITVEILEELRDLVKDLRGTRDPRGLRGLVESLDKAITAHGKTIDKLLLLEGKAGRITETRAVTIDVVELVRMMEQGAGRQLPMEFIDAIGGTDE